MMAEDQKFISLKRTAARLHGARVPKQKAVLRRAVAQNILVQTGAEFAPRVFFWTGNGVTIDALSAEFNSVP